MFLNSNSEKNPKDKENFKGSSKNSTTKFLKTSNALDVKSLKKYKNSQQSGYHHQLNGKGHLPPTLTSTMMTTSLNGVKNSRVSPSSQVEIQQKLDTTTNGNHASSAVANNQNGLHSITSTKSSKFTNNQSSNISKENNSKFSYQSSACSTATLPSKANSATFSTSSSSSTSPPQSYLPNYVVKSFR